MSKINNNFINLFLLILYHLIAFIKHSNKHIFNNEIETKYAKFTQKIDSNMNIIIIKNETFNMIDLDRNERMKIKKIIIQKGSKIEGDCSQLFAYFENCEYIEIENLDTSKATNMKEMFKNDLNIKYLNLINFDTSNTIDMSYMFCGCQNLKKLDLTNFNISTIDARNAISTIFMFDSCISLKELDLSKFYTEKLIYRIPFFSPI